MWVHTKNPMTTSDYQIISGGGGINFWKIEGSHLQKKAGRFGSSFKQIPIMCVANLNMKGGWRIIAGGSNGDFMVFEEREVISCVEGAHKGSVLCMAEVREKGECVCVCLCVCVHVCVWVNMDKSILARDLILILKNKNETTIKIESRYCDKVSKWR